MLFKPKAILNIFTDFDMNKYYQEGFDTILLDIDNTIAIPDTGSMDERAKNFILDLKKTGFNVCIFSNNYKERVKSFIGDNDIDFMHMVCKPLPFAYLLAVLRYKTSNKRTIVMGDQLLTDILGANLSGCYGIYCKQLVEQDSKTTARNRKIEKIIWRYIK